MDRIKLKFDALSSSALREHKSANLIEQTVEIVRVTSEEVRQMTGGERERLYRDNIVQMLSENAFLMNNDSIVILPKDELTYLGNGIYGKDEVDE